MHVLVVEDEPTMAALLQSTLREEGYHVTCSMRGDEALALARTGSFDLVVLDLMLPGLDGFQISKRLRAERVQTPILILTARDQPEDLIRALDGGADDYLAKPFSLNVFLARVRAVSRRGSIPQPVCFEAGSLRLNTATREVSRDGRAITLTPREFGLLQALMKNKGRVLPRARIVEAVWGCDAEVEDNTLDAFIRLLRQKIEFLDTPKLIRTVRGVGYSLQDPGA